LSTKQTNWLDGLRKSTASQMIVLSRERLAEAELVILSARAVRAQLLDTTSSELAPNTKADGGRHSEEGSRGGRKLHPPKREI
jgi:hypothetical protein